ncbi:MAG: glycosyltransferase family 39 protein, partial [Candidatus Omnitrophica bacterium]|nr:glycosyltransferase family 39 protein [Candidatus Omnitrophota bacterium]
MIKKKILFIFIIAFALRILYLAFSGQPQIGLDSQWYNQVAESIAKGQGFSVNGAPTAYTVPIYPLFLAGIYKLFSSNVNWVFTFQIFLGAINCVLIYIITRELFNEKIALLSGIITSFYYFFIKCENMILTEAIFMPLVTLSVLLFIKAKETKKILY